MLILKTRRRIVIRGCVPKASTCNPHSLILALTNGDLRHELVTRNVERGLDLLFDLVRNVFGQFLELVAVVGPFFDPFVINLECVVKGREI